jgi:hypothetical protein
MSDLPLLPLQPVIDLLKTGAPMLRSVGSAAELAAVMKRGVVIAGPAAFVVPGGAVPYDQREGSGPLRVDAVVTVSVVLGLTLAGKTGAEGLQAAEAPADAVRGLLFGWKHPDALRKFTWASEGPEDLNAETNVLLYRLDFETAVRITETYV